MLKAEYEQVTVFKKYIASFCGQDKRSGLLRAGLALLAVLNDVEQTIVIASVERINTWAPGKEIGALRRL